MSRRKLTQEELNLWRRVTDQTDPLKPEPEIPQLQQVRLPQPQFIPAPRLATVKLAPKVKTGRSAVSLDLAEQLSTRPETAPLQMDHKAYKRMKRGKLRPEARIDLHGKTLNRAHPVLVRFILAAAAEDKRLVLVITGKGRDRDDGDPIPSRRGVLRHQLPQWLTTPPLSSHVIQFSPAHISHGGDGAFYVYLRRRR